MTLVEIEKLVRNKIDDCGTHAEFFINPNDPKQGIKLYRTELQRDFHYNRHVIGYELGVMPGYGRKFDIAYEGGWGNVHSWGYEVDVITPIEHKSRNYGYEISDQYYDLQKILNDAGYELVDELDCNFGWNDDKFLLIDAGCIEGDIKPTYGDMLCQKESSY